jgi:Ca-activated chloride channel homolog
MSFIAPLALALGALAIPIILLYMLRLRRREVPVSSTMLWQQLLRDREANSPWQRLRRNLLLLLQLAILAALVIALARPYMEVPTLTSGRTVLLIDASASMRSTDVQPSRFEAARGEARNILSTLGTGDTAAIIRVAETAEVVENYTSDTSLLYSALDRIGPGNAAADWEAALTLAAAGAIGAERFSVIIVSDGGLPPGLLANFGEVRFVPIGSGDSNLAITALSADNDPVSGAQIYARIDNFGAVDTPVVFSVNLDGTLFSASEYTVPANGSTDVLVSELPAEFNRVEAVLTRPAASSIPDYLPVDDQAWTVYDPQQAGRVVLMGSNLFLEEFFLNTPTWELFRGDPSVGIPEAAFDLYIFDGWLPDTLPNGNMLIVNPPWSTDLFTVGDLTEQTELTNVLENDPRTRYLRFNDVNVRQFKEVIDTGWAQPIVSAEGGALVLAGEADGWRVAIITFALNDSDLPLKIAFPILMANLTDWYKAPRVLDLGTGRIGGGSLRPGQTLTIQPQSDATQVRVQRPDGATSTLDVDRPLLIYGDTPLPGIYNVEVYRGSELVQTDQFAVNLFDVRESRIAVQQPTFSGQTLTGAAQEETGQREFWTILALVALAILALEWFVYHRRVRTPRPRTAAMRGFTGR